MNKSKSLLAVLSTCSILSLAGSAIGAEPAPKITDWTDWGGDTGRTHYSPLSQINTKNVSQLKPVWIYDPGTVGRGWENTPLLIDGILYVSDAKKGDIVALEPETGKELWRNKATRDLQKIRGLTYWAGTGSMKPRLLLLREGHVQGLDLKSGQPVSDWPADGFVVGLPSNDPQAGDDPAAGRAGRGGGNNGGTNSSPGVVYKNLLIVSGSSGFNPGPGVPADTRAYDLRNGQLVWHNGAIAGRDGNPGPADSWGPKTDQVRGSGSWGILSLDQKSGTVYVGTDSAGPDYTGIWRPGDNKWSDSTIALDAATGKMKWAFQTHHHDLFDYDTMSAPTVTEVKKGGQTIPLVVQTTKPGMMWIFDARDGKPLYGYEERPVAQSQVPGEHSSPTQPFTLGPPPLGQMSIDRDHLSQLSPQAHAECLKVWDEQHLQNAGPFTPPFPSGMTVYIPGSSGAVSWGGVSIDPKLQYAITNVTNIPVMNSFGQNPTGTDAIGNNGWRTIGNFTRFADSKGRPCIGGRIGELVAVNLATGKIAWRVPMGTLEDDYGQKGKESGAPNIGPSIVTAGGLIFIGAAADERFHVYDTKTGKLLWQTKMSASGVAGPLTYMGKDGRQYVVIAAGGPGTAQYRTDPQWGYHQTLVAFAIPRKGEKPIDIVTPYPKRMPNPGETFSPQ